MHLARYVALLVLVAVPVSAADARVQKYIGTVTEGEAFLVDQVWLAAQIKAAEDEKKKAAMTF